METEKIDVPKFDGFECIGIRISHGSYDVYVLNADGNGLVISSDLVPLLQTIALPCYRKIKPKRITFEYVGNGSPKAGEWARLSDDVFTRANTARAYECEIYRIVEDQS